MNKKTLTILFTNLLVIIFTNLSAQAQKVTNEQIYKVLMELKIKDEQILREIKVFEAKTEERFKAIDQRFEAIDQRFEMMDKRFEQLERAMYSKFGDMTTIMWIIASIFTPLMLAFIGLLFWDRKTIIDTCVTTAVDKIESEEGMLIRLVNAFKELAKKNKEVATVLKQFNLL